MLKDVVIKNAKPKDKQYKIYDDTNLYLRISPKGTKTFVFRYRIKGKDKTINIGKYPAITLAQARVIKNNYILNLEQGKDPKGKDINNSTFREVANSWFKTLNNSPKTIKNKKSHLDIINTFLGDYDISEIKPKMVLDFLKGYEIKSVYATKKMKIVISQVYDYAIFLDMVEFNPTYNVSKYLKPLPKNNYKHLTDIRDIANMVFDIKSSTSSSVIVRYATLINLYTFVRSYSLRHMEWNEIKGNLWHIPAEKTKLKRPHIVPLAKQVLKLLYELRAFNGYKKYVFAIYDQPISDNTIRVNLRRLGYEQTPHGFRHIASTILNEKNYNPDAIELQLEHITKGVRGVYNKSQKLEYRQNMMQDWADYLDSLIPSNSRELKS